MTDLLSELRALCEGTDSSSEVLLLPETLRSSLARISKDAVCVILSPDDVNAIESALALREYRMRTITFGPGVAEEKALTDPLRRIVAEARRDR